MGRTRSRRPSVEKPTGEFQFDRDSSNVLGPDQASVREYLHAHPHLGQPLSSVCDATRHAFGPDAELSLELYRDPEADDRYLTLYVRLEKYDARILERIEAVRLPFEDQLAQFSGHLLVTTDFRPPHCKLPLTAPPNHPNDC
jgi:hypothetical protein